jgi:hypothetical protein
MYTVLFLGPRSILRWNLLKKTFSSPFSVELLNGRYPYNLKFLGVIKFLRCIKLAQKTQRSKIQLSIFYKDWASVETNFCNGGNGTARDRRDFFIAQNMLFIHKHFKSAKKLIFLDMKPTLFHISYESKV